MRPAWVYGLYSTDDPENIRYIGVSIRPLIRLTTHRSDINSLVAFKNNPHKVRWMRLATASGATIELKLLSEFPAEHEAYASEDSFIDEYKSKGHPLTNKAKGGRGGVVVPETELEGFHARRSAILQTPEHRAKMSVIKKKEFEAPERYTKHVDMVRRNASSPEWREAVSQGQKIALESNDFRAKANATRRLPENREKARNKSLELSKCDIALQRSKDGAKKRWDNTPKDQRTPWNKGMTFVEKPKRMGIGSEEYKEHARQSTLRHFEKVRNDPALLEQHKASRKEVGKKVSISKKSEWAGLSEIEYNNRRHKMVLGRRLGAAKRNGWVLDLNPITHQCKDSV